MVRFETAQRSLFRRVAVWTVCALGGLVLAWFLLERVLLSQVGLDFSDEGLYLIAGDPPSSDTAWVFPAGWSTSALFALTGYDIANFRTLGALLLTGVSGFLGWLSFDITAKLFDPSPTDANTCSTRGKRVLQSLVAIGVALTSLSFYASMLRTPGYNWVNLMGLVISACGALLVLRRTRRIHALLDSADTWVAIRSQTLPLGIMAFGIFFTAPAKPTSAIFIALAVLVLLSVWFGPRFGIAMTVAISAATFIFIFVAVVTRMWTLNFLAVFLEGASKPPLVANQTVFGGLADFFVVPADVYQDIRGEPRVWVAIVGLSLLVLLIAAAVRIPPLVQVIALIALITSALLHTRDEGWPYWQQIWERGTLTTSMLLVVAGVVLTSIGVSRWDGNQLSRKATPRIIAAAGFLVLLVFAYGFGSSLRPFVTAKFALVLLVAAAIVGTGVLLRTRARGVLISLTLILALAYTAVVQSQGRIFQYGFTPLQNQSVEVTLAPRGSTLLLSGERARLVNGISTAIEAAGGSSIRLLGVGPDTATLTYVSGATLPSTVLVTWFAQDGMFDLAEHNLQNLDPAEWEDSWILLSQRKPETDRIMGIIGEYLCRSFPEDYEKVYEQDLVAIEGKVSVSDGRYSLWKPKVTGRPEVSDPCVS